MYHGDKDMQDLAMPEPMRPRPLRRHHPRIGSRPLRGNLLRRERGTVVLGHRIVLLETGAVGRRVELGRLLEHNGLAATAVAGRESDGHNILRDGNTDTPPGRALEREEESREQSSRCHCFLCRLLPTRRGSWIC